MRERVRSAPHAPTALRTTASANPRGSVHTLQHAVGNRALHGLLESADPQIAHAFRQAPFEVAAVLAARRGRPLEPGVRGELEPLVGEDLSGVRVHDDTSAAASAEVVVQGPRRDLRRQRPRRLGARRSRDRHRPGRARGAARAEPPGHDRHHGHGTPRAPAPPKPGPDIFKLPPPGPETPEERLNRILKEPLPSGPQKRSFSEAFWKWADENVIDRGLSSLGIAKKYRGLLRDVAHAAVEKGAESALDKAMDAAHLDSKQKDAFRAIIRQLMQMK